MIKLWLLSTHSNAHDKYFLNRIRLEANLYNKTNNKAILGTILNALSKLHLLLM